MPVKLVCLLSTYWSFGYLYGCAGFELPSPVSLGMKIVSANMGFIHVVALYHLYFKLICFPLAMNAVDIISAIEFDKTGEHLATGDRGGRVVLFERMDGRDVRSVRSSFLRAEASVCCRMICPVSA